MKQDLKREIEIIFFKSGLTSRLKTQDELLSLIDKYRREYLANFLEWMIENTERFNPNKPAIMLADEFIKNKL